MATKKKRASSKKSIKLESFQACNETAPFISLRVTEQTVYWSVLLVYVLVLSLWILNIQLQTLEIINSINLS
jgi:hypothetical protein